MVLKKLQPPSIWQRNIQVYPMAQKKDTVVKENFNFFLGLLHDFRLRFNECALKITSSLTGFSPVNINHEISYGKKYWGKKHKIHNCKKKSSFWLHVLKKRTRIRSSIFHFRKNIIPVQNVFISEHNAKNLVTVSNARILRKIIAFF